MKLRELRRLLRIWAKRLRMEDWQFEVRWAKREDMMHPDEDGNVIFAPEFQRAEILILAPRYRTEASASPEEDLIHELLHLVLEGHSPRSKYDAMYERGLNQISKALWRAYQGVAE